MAFLLLIIYHQLLLHVIFQKELEVALIACESSLKNHWREHFTLPTWKMWKLVTLVTAQIRDKLKSDSSCIFVFFMPFSKVIVRSIFNFWQINWRWIRPDRWYDSSTKSHQDCEGIKRIIWGEKLVVCLDGRECKAWVCISCCLKLPLSYLTLAHIRPFYHHHASPQISVPGCKSSSSLLPCFAWQ